MFCCKEDREFTKGALGWIGTELGAGKGKALVAAGGSWGQAGESAARVSWDAVDPAQWLGLMTF